MTFDDGSTYQFNETVKTESLKEGSRIKVTALKTRVPLNLSEAGLV